jgi:hypothetical protein
MNRRVGWTWWCIAGWLVVLWTALAFAEEEYKFDLSETEKKPYHLGGYLEVKPILFGLDRDASLYRLKFYKHDAGNRLAEYDGTLRLEGSLESGMAKLYLKGNLDVRRSYLGWDTSETESLLYEGYLSLKPSSNISLKLGKQTLLWGKGYAWNPVAFVSRPKDPDDPELGLQGYVMASADFIKSFEGPLKTVSFTPVLFPVYSKVNDDFGKRDQLNVAGKLYLLLYDTDIDFIGMTGGSRTSRVGVDFSKNISSNLEVHGEWAFINNQKKTAIDANGVVSKSENDVKSYLLGVRYLAPWDMTFILEYYRNGTGFAPYEMRDYLSLIDKGYDLFLKKKKETLLQKAGSVTEGNYGRMNPMKDYLYLRVSQKEPFNILYFTPAFTAITNLDDRSLSLSPELLYEGVKNLEIRLKAARLVGGKWTEYGEKQNDYRLELRVRYYF